MIFKFFKSNYARRGRDYGRRFIQLREKAPGFLKLPFDEILKKCEIPEDVYRVYESGTIPPWKPHALALQKHFNVNVNWLLFGIGEMFGGITDFPARLRKMVSRQSSEDLPAYYLVWQMMKNPQMEEFFILLINIILSGGLEGLYSAIKKNPTYADFIKNSAPGTNDAGKE